MGEIRSGYDPQFFSALVKVEDEHFWFRTRNRIISAIASRLVNDLAPGYHVLEVGCGTGNVLRHLEKACASGTVMGTDLYYEGLQFARARVRASLVQSDMRHAPFRQQFALIGLFDVLEHLEADLDMLCNLHQLLLPGGTLLLTVPAHMSLYSYFDKAAQHARRYSAHELRDKLLQTGFEVEFLTEYMSMIFPVVWAARKLASVLDKRLRRSPLTEDARARELTSREFHIPPLLNQALYSALSLEAKLVCAQRRLPVGTSILAVARRPT